MWDWIDKSFFLQLAKVFPFTDAYCSPLAYRNPFGVAQIGAEVLFPPHWGGKNIEFGLVGSRGLISLNVEDKLEWREMTISGGFPQRTITNCPTAVNLAIWAGSTTALWYLIWLRSISNDKRERERVAVAYKRLSLSFTTNQFSTMVIDCYQLLKLWVKCCLF